MYYYRDVEVIILNNTCKRCKNSDFDQKGRCKICGFFDNSENQAYKDIEEPEEKQDAKPYISCINSHMTGSILSTVLFFNLILGIPSIVFAHECEQAVRRNDLETAKRFSRRALNFMSATIISSLFVIAAAVFIIICCLISTTSFK